MVSVCLGREIPRELGNHRTIGKNPVARKITRGLGHKPRMFVSFQVIGDWVELDLICNHGES
jgi:hypothetical protein